MNKITWDLTKIFESDRAWQQELESCKKEITLIDSWDKNILNSGKLLLNTIEKNDLLERRIFKVYEYAKLKKDANGLDNEANKMYMSSEKLYETFTTKTNFISNKLKALTKSKLNVLYEEEPKLKTYDYLFKLILKNKKHILSFKEENLLLRSSNIRNAFEEVFSKIDYVDVKFDNVLGEALNHATYSVFLKDKDQNKRRIAWENYHEYYKKHANTISECLINSIKNDCFISEVKKYSSPLRMSMDSDNINPKVYQDLISSVHKNLPLFQDYFALKKKSLKLNDLHMYDLYVKCSDYNPKYIFSEAKDLVINSVGVLGSDYQNNYKKAFTERWIDPFYHEGKYSGAYSAGTYDTYPYVLMNFKDDFNSVETLAHEMGHSMHSYYSHTNNPYHLSSYPIFLAEIASNVNELLLFDYMLKNSKNKKEKKYILETILESFKGSIFRQTQFAEYENILHDKIGNEEALGSKDITDIYYELNKLYYGDNVISDDLIRYEALRIPHFYSAFYVYKYATGLAIAYVFAKRILNNESGALESYLKFLKIGGTKYPLEVLKECGIDFNIKIVDEAMEIFKSYLNDYKELLGSE